MASTLNEAFMRFVRRAEVVDRAKLVDTFVDAGPLLTLLKCLDHQVVYGRRGTGKTHALSYLAEDRLENGDLPVYVDLRSIGSSGGIYGDTATPLTERGTRLLIDTLAAIHDGILDQVVRRDEEFNLAEVGPILDGLADALTEVAIVGEVEQTDTAEAASGSEDHQEVRFGLSRNPELAYTASAGETRSTRFGTRYTETGIAHHRVHFGRVAARLQDLRTAFGGTHVWVILDEWANVPLDLQPYLADFLRRSVFPVRGFTVKIGAIEQRSRFRIPTGQGDYVGLELGADVTADINLDDFMVFENDPDRAKDFFQELLFRHLRAVEEVADDELSSNACGNPERRVHPSNCLR